MLSKEEIENSKRNLKRSLEAELLKIERQDKIYGVGETRYDLMIRDVLNYIENLEENYENLVRISIETAFDEKNEDTEFLLRCLLKQGKISLNKEKQEYENPQKDKEFDVIGIKFEREKCFLIEDDKLDEYTKQLEYKLENSIPKKKIEEILNNKYRLFFEGDEEFPDMSKTINAIKYIKAEVLEKLLEEK